MNAWSPAYNLSSRRAAHEHVCIHSDRVTLLGNCFLVACCCSMRLSPLKSDAPIVRTRAPRPASSLTTVARATPTSRLCGCSHLVTDKVLPLVRFPEHVVLIASIDANDVSAQVGAPNAWRSIWGSGAHSSACCSLYFAGCIVIRRSSHSNLGFSATRTDLSACAVVTR
jgi:hypothetical protein